MTDTSSPSNPLDVGRVLIGIAVAALALAVVVLLSDVLMLAFAGVLVGIALRGSARWLHARLGLPVPVGLALVALGVVVLTGLFLWLVGPQLDRQSDQLADQLGDWWVAGTRWLEQKHWAAPLVEKLQANIGLGVSFATSHLSSAFFTTFGLAGTLVVVLFTGLYLATDPSTYRTGALRLVPPRRRARADAILNALDHILRMWLLGRILDMLAVLLLTYAGLTLLGAPLALALAVLAGVLNFIPYIGAIAGAVPAILIALGQSPAEALWVAVLFAVIQSLEGYLLAPMIQRRTVNLPPAMTILSQTVFGALLGFMGLLFAPALATVAMTLTRMIYVEDVLGDRAEPKVD